MLIQNLGFSQIPVYIQRLLDEIIGTNQATLIWRYAGFALLLAIMTATSTYFMRRLITGASRHIEYELRDRLFRTLLNLSTEFYQQRRTGDIISRCTNDLNDVRTLLGPGIMYIPDTFSRIALFIPIFLQLNVTMTISLGIFTVTLICVNVLVIPRFRPLFRVVQEQVASINDLVWQTVTGITTVRLYGAENYQKVRFSDRNRNYIRSNMRVTKIKGILWPVMMFVLGLMELIILWIGGKEVIQGTMSLGELLQFSAMVGILTFPILSVGWVMSLLQQGISALDRLEDIFFATPEKRTGKQPTSTKPGQDIKIENVSYRYPNATVNALDSINFEVKSGQVIGITGPVGSGKSTLVSLIGGMLRPSHGNLNYNNTSLAEIDLIALRSRIAFVPQETFLFSMSVAENIAMGSEKRNFNEKTISRAAEAAAVAMDIETFPEGYNQLVGERGITLSGGQKQRIALARALIRVFEDDSDLLILDDALSSVDSETETKILSSLRQINVNHLTTVIVSQRVSALQTADLLWILKNGTINETGDPENLSGKKNGFYSRMKLLQQLGTDIG